MEEILTGSGRGWDPDDLRLIRALQLAPRASFATLGDILGVHQRTIARRYRRLRRDGIVRIFGVVNPMAVGQQSWSVRVRCRPDSSEALAHALASRDDVAWVALSAAGSEVSFAIRTLLPERRELLLTRLLPRTAHVLDITATVVLHVFLGLKSHDWSGLESRLSPAETSALALLEAVPAGSPPLVTLDPPDQPMLGLLAADGRASLADLATAAGMSEGRTRRRLDALLASKVLSIDLDLATEAFGFLANAHLYLQAVPSRLHAIGEELAAVPEVVYVAAMSGRDNLMVSINCRDAADLYRLTTAVIGSIDGVQAMEVVPFLRVIKQSGGMLADGRLVDRLA